MAEVVAASKLRGVQLLRSVPRLTWYLRADATLRQPRQPRQHPQVHRHCQQPALTHQLLKAHSYGHSRRSHLAWAFLLWPRAAGDG